MAPATKPPASLNDLIKQHIPMGSLVGIALALVAHYSEQFLRYQESLLSIQRDQLVEMAQMRRDNTSILNSFAREMSEINSRLNHLERDMESIIKSSK